MRRPPAHLKGDRRTPRQMRRPPAHLGMHHYVSLFNSHLDKMTNHSHFHLVITGAQWVPEMNTFCVDFVIDGAFIFYEPDGIDRDEAQVRFEI